MKRRSLKMCFCALSFFACSPLSGGGGDVDPGPNMGGNSSGGAASTWGGAGNLGGLPGYCDCPLIERENGQQTRELSCFCEYEDCSALQEETQDYNVITCTEGEARSLPGQSFYFRDEELIGLNRFRESCDGTTSLKVGESSCLPEEPCNPYRQPCDCEEYVGGAGGCLWVQPVR